MASKDVEDWDKPLPSSAEEQTAESEDGLTYEERRHIENIEKLTKYVEDMSFIPVRPPAASPYTHLLARPHKRKVVGNAKDFAHIMEPPERGDRMRRLASEYNTITTEYIIK